MRSIDVNNKFFNRWIYNITVSSSVQSSLIDLICKICNLYVASQAGPSKRGASTQGSSNFYGPVQVIKYRNFTIVFICFSITKLSYHVDPRHCLGARYFCRKKRVLYNITDNAIMFITNFTKDLR